MKKTLFILTLALCLLAFCGCTGAVLDIDSYEWQLQSATKANLINDSMTELSSVAVLSARNGKLTLTDSESGAVYEGTYMLTDSNSKGRDYAFTFGSFTGHGILSVTDYYGELSVPTLSVSISDGLTRYTLLFQANE